MEVPDGPGDGVKGKGLSIWTSYEIFIKIHSQKLSQDSTYPPSHFLESWRTWRFLKDLDVVSKERDYPSEPPVKVSSRSKVRNCVKTSPILQVTSWCLGGHGSSWWTWRWCQRKGTIHLIFLWKFHQDPSLRTHVKKHVCYYKKCDGRTHGQPQI